MDYGSYESTQCIELSWPEDGCRETEFLITLTCVTPGTPAQLYGPPENCYEAEAAEFELESIHVLDDDGNPVKISEEIMAAIMGKELAQAVIEDAETDAMDSGDF